MLGGVQQRSPERRSANVDAVHNCSATNGPMRRSSDAEPQVATFRSPELDARFRRDGYVVVPRFHPDEVADLRSRFEAIYVGERADSCHRSNESSDIGYRRALHELITEALDPVVEDFLVDHRSFSSGALVKWKGPGSAMPAHQDWTMVDEPRFRAVSIWVPLCNVSLENGALGVLPGSQRVLTGMRPNPGTAPTVVDPAGDVDPATLPSVSMEAGSCMIFDHGVLHGSPPNRLDHPRIALVLAAAPDAATLQHLWRRPEDDRIERFEVTDQEFFRHCTPGIRPTHPAISSVETLLFEPHPPTARAWVLTEIARHQAERDGGAVGGRPVANTA